jgi:hypothetical protein
MAGVRFLTARGIPETLHLPLSAVSGQQAAELVDDRLDDIRQRLAAATPTPIAQATVLLSWLGKLSVPNEALYGEGVLVRRLLADISISDLARRGRQRPERTRRDRRCQLETVARRRHAHRCGRSHTAPAVSTDAHPRQSLTDPPGDNGADSLAFSTSSKRDSRVNPEEHLNQPAST